MSQDTQPLHGVIPVIATPFDKRMHIDDGALGNEIDWLFSHGIDGVAIAMVSEIQRLSDNERNHLTEVTCSFVAGRVPVLASVGAESSILACEFARAATGSGAAALIAPPPLLTSLSFDGLRSYLDAIFSVSGLPVVLQDASGYVGQSLSPDLQARLVDVYGPNRVYLKPEGVPSGPNITAIRNAAKCDPIILDGSGGNKLVDAYLRGIDGTMPGPDLVWLVRRIWEALLLDKIDEAQAISVPLVMVQSALDSLDDYVVLEKHLLHLQGVISDPRVRGPISTGYDSVTLGLATRVFTSAIRSQ